MIFFRFSLCCAVMVAALAAVVASGARAQDAPCSHPACTANPPLGNACRIYLNAEDGDASFHRSAIAGTVAGVSRTRPAGCYQPGVVYGLQGWRFNTRGGHKIKQAAFLQEVDSMRIVLVDHNGDDVMDGYVWLVPLPEGTVLRDASESDCRGACRLTLARKAADEVVVLAGFDLNRDENDGHVIQFSVGPVIGTATEPQIEVTFQDDAFDYEARVQYAYVPVSAVRESGSVSSTYDPPGGGFGTATITNDAFPDPALRRDTAEGDAVLRGFSFVFRNGGHFIEDIGLERRSSEYEAWYQDNQGRGARRHPDDPFDWSADFVILR